MRSFSLLAGLATLTLGITDLTAQEWAGRFGLNVYATWPAGDAADLYGSGWKVGIPIYFRIGQPVEGRLRLEFGEFKEGTPQSGHYETMSYRARTRLVGYDWLIALGPRRPTGVDLILGIGGAHWYQDMRTTSPFPYSDTDQDLAFAATVGLSLRIRAHLYLELHHVLTSHPSGDSDFEDAGLSHTALGLGVRF